MDLFFHSSVFMVWGLIKQGITLFYLTVTRVTTSQACKCGDIGCEASFRNLGEKFGRQSVSYVKLVHHICLVWEI